MVAGVRRCFANLNYFSDRNHVLMVLWRSSTKDRSLLKIPPLRGISVKNMKSLDRDVKNRTILFDYISALQPQKYEFSYLGLFWSEN